MGKTQEGLKKNYEKREVLGVMDSQDVLTEWGKILIKIHLQDTLLALK